MKVIAVKFFKHVVPHMLNYIISSNYISTFTFENEILTIFFVEEDQTTRLRADLAELQHFLCKVTITVLNNMVERKSDGATEI